jgi:penicillin-binding protein 2
VRKLILAQFVTTGHERRNQTACILILSLFGVLCGENVVGYNQRYMERRLFYLLLVVMVVAVGCGTGFPIPQDSYQPFTSTPNPATIEAMTGTPTPPPDRDSPDGLARAFYRAWENFDYDGMYSLLTPQSQALVPRGDFWQRYESAMTTARVQAVTSQAQALRQDGDLAEFSVRVVWETAVVGTITRDHTVRLSYDTQANRWGVVWHEGLILPEMEGGGRLSLEYRIPARANIYDRNGLALAFQGSVISLGIIPGEIEDEMALLNALSPVLGRPSEDIRTIYAHLPPGWYVPIGDIPEATMQEHALALQPFIGKGLAPPRTRLARIYPQQGVAPHIVGYVAVIPAGEEEGYIAQGYRGDELVGRAGLERWGEDYLNGERGGRLSVVGPSGEFIAMVQEREPRQARSIYTTIERDFQAAVENALAEAIRTHPLGRAGSVVVLDVKTGAVLALASYPTYNPAIFDQVRPEAQAALGQILNDPAQPLLNRVTQGAYPTGSIFTVITLAAGLESGQYTMQSRYTSTGTWTRLGGNLVMTDWRQGGHGTVNMAQAITVSCNSCFFDMGLNVNNQDPLLLPNTARAFGLGQPTGIQLNEAAGLIPDNDWKINNIGEGWAPGDAVNLAVGQGFLQATPLQIANVFAAIANNGLMLQPTVVDRIGAGGGAPEERLPVRERGQLPYSPEALATLQQALWEVANNQNMGTAAFQLVGLPIQTAGKTGTAEAPPRSPHAWYGGYAPAAPYTTPDGRTITEPEIAVVVMIEHAGEGSAVAVPIFRRIIELYYGIMPVTPFPW